MAHIGTPSLRLNVDTFSAALARNGISGNTQISKRLGISLATVKRIMNGQQDPSNMFLAAACVELKTPLDAIVKITCD